MSVDLSGRRVLITGGASGIGAACAEKFAAAGALVTVADLDGQDARKVAEPLGGTFARVDLTNPSFDAAALAANQDIIVNNAGIQHVSPVEEFPEEKFRQILALMLEAPFRLVRPADVVRERLLVRAGRRLDRAVGLPWREAVLKGEPPWRSLTMVHGRRRGSVLCSGGTCHTPGRCRSCTRVACGRRPAGGTPPTRSRP